MGRHDKPTAGVNSRTSRDISQKQQHWRTMRSGYTFGRIPLTGALRVRFSPILSHRVTTHLDAVGIVHKPI